jgi:hypothetical protein
MLVFLLFALAQTLPDSCQAKSAQALQEARALIGRAGPASAQTMLVESARTDPTCAPLLGAGWSISGWVTARAAARAGGTGESLAGATTAIATLETLGTRPEWRVESEYARTAIRAAMAAAQDERPEMAIFLAHARGLSDRLTLAQATPEWPLPIDAIEGDLWLEVDRYDEARAAFERARATSPTGFVLVGLARTKARLGDERGACDTYREAMDRSERAVQDEARAYLKRPACAR